MPLNQEQNVILVDFQKGNPTIAGEIRYDGGSFLQQDTVGVYNPRTVWQPPHEVAASLSHFIGDWTGGAVYCSVVGSPFISTRNYYSDSGMTKLVAQVTYTRNANQQTTARTTKVYAADGVTVANSMTDTFTLNSAGFPTGFSRTSP